MIAKNPDYDPEEFKKVRDEQLFQRDVFLHWQKGKEKPYTPNTPPSIEEIQMDTFEDFF